MAIINYVKNAINASNSKNVNKVVRVETSLKITAVSISKRKTKTIEKKNII